MESKMTSEEKKVRQSIADKKYRLAHPEKCKAKDRRRYEENKESERVRNSSYYMLNREIQRVKHRDNRHHIEPGWFDAKVADQDNKCALCLKEFIKTPHIDHNHGCCPPLKSCEKCRRDLLCDDCNLGLGRFKDDIEVLERAIQYLKRHKESQCSI
jgi:hypothetical protein